MNAAGHRTSHDDLLRELTLLVRSRYGLIWIKTAEEERMETLIRYLADALNLMLFIWTPTKGLSRDTRDEQIYGTGDAKAALDHIDYAMTPAIYYFQGLGPFLEDRMLRAKICEAARSFSRHEGAMIVTGAEFDIPDAVMGHTAVVIPPAPGREEFQDLLRRILQDLKTRMPVKMELSGPSVNLLLNNLQGLTLMEAEKILTKAIVEDGRLDASDVDVIIQEKKRIIEREGLLEFTPTEHGFSDIADLITLKAWLAKRKNIITDPQGAAKFGLSFPKGILLLGIPGSGKSLCAKAVAMEWGLPLLRMDPSRLYNRRSCPRWSSGSTRLRRLSRQETVRTVACPSGFSEASSRGFRIAEGMFLLQQLQTISIDCRLNSCARDGSTRFSSWICLIQTRAGRSSRSISDCAVTIPNILTWRAWPMPLMGSPVPRSNRRSSQHCTQPSRVKHA
jgi:hypothetical protein